MDLNQIRKAISDGNELEYLFGRDEWLPAVASLQDSNFLSPTITITLLRYPRGHSGIIRLNANDVKHRLRVKGSD